MDQWILGLRCRVLPCQGSMGEVRLPAWAGGSAQPAEGSLPTGLWAWLSGTMLRTVLVCEPHYPTPGHKGLGMLTEGCCALGGRWNGTRDTLVWPFFMSTFLQETGRVFKQNLMRNTSSFSMFHGKH